MASFAERPHVKILAWRAVLLALIIAQGPFVLFTQDSPQPKNVLILDSFADHPFLDRDALRSAIGLRVRFPVNLYLELFESPRFDDPSYEKEIVERIRRTYVHQKLDLVMPRGTPILQLAAKYHDELFPGVPIVFWDVASLRIADQNMWPGVTGVTDNAHVGATIDLALRLHPNTDTVAIITDDTSWQRKILAAVHADLIRRQKTMNEIDLVGLPTVTLLERIAALPPHTIALMQLVPGHAGPVLGYYDILAVVSQRVPTYSFWQHLCLDHGCIGGVSDDAKQQLTVAAEVASRVLSGEPVQNIPVMSSPGQDITLDWRQLRRWDIPESVLPPGTVVLWRQPSLWERYRKYMISGTALIVVQSLLIFGLLWQRTRRRKTEAQLKRSEEKFSKSFRKSPLAITIADTNDGHYIDVNEAFERHTGWRRDEVIGRSPLEIGLWLDPDQRFGFLEQLRAKGNVTDLELKFRRKDGQIRTGLGSAEVIEVHGKRCALSVIADITERKTAEQALATLSGRLIETQEAERARIARELHDDINQQVAMVAVNLRTAKRHLSVSEAGASGYIEEASARISELENDIQALSHRLHSSKLEYLGLEGAAQSFCREVSERHDVRIDFHCDGISEGVPPGISLCLFRVLQEAVHNAVKHSGVPEIKVLLECTSSEMRLTVHDFGVGFDPCGAVNGHGLGLTSMRERLRLVHGQLEIDSSPHHGTTIFARVPVDTNVSTAGAEALGSHDHVLGSTDLGRGS
jgi:PAS domain S-box-containing protein